MIEKYSKQRITDTKNDESQMHLYHLNKVRIKDYGLHASIWIYLGTLEKAELPGFGIASYDKKKWKVRQVLITYCDSIRKRLGWRKRELSPLYFHIMEWHSGQGSTGPAQKWGLCHYQEKPQPKAPVIL
jgi:hypothetical protein